MAIFPVVSNWRTGFISPHHTEGNVHGSPTYPCPYRFQRHADYALDYAIELAQKLQARLTLLHIIDTMPLGVVEEESKLPPSYWHELETNLGQSMEASLKRLTDVGLQGGDHHRSRRSLPIHSRHR
jgi:nucleotide-binding universal stress UspA family protein